MRIVRLVLALALLVAWPRLCLAQGAQTYEQLTVGQTVVGLAVATRTGMTHCRGTLETAAVRIAYNNTIPTATVGQPVAVNDEIVLQNPGDIVNFRAIAVGGVSGLVNMTCSSGTPLAGSFVRSGVSAATTTLSPTVPTPVRQSATDLRACMTTSTTAAVNNQVTLTITPPSGLHVYLCGLDMTSSQAAAATANTNLTYTSTNLGGWLWKYSLPATINLQTTFGVMLPPGLAIKSNIPGTAVTIVSPGATANTAFSITGYYRYAP